MIYAGTGGSNIPDLSILLLRIILCKKEKSIAK